MRFDKERMRNAWGWRTSQLFLFMILMRGAAIGKGRLAREAFKHIVKIGLAIVTTGDGDIHKGSGGGAQEAAGLGQANLG